MNHRPTQASDAPQDERAPEGRVLRSALNAGVTRREVWAWAMYDFANSGYTTVVLTTVFSAYFVGVVAAGKDWGTLAFTGALSLSYLLVMLTMPTLGARADARAGKRRLRSEEHTSELQSRPHLVCRLLLEKKKITKADIITLT